MLELFKAAFRLPIAMLSGAAGVWAKSLNDFQDSIEQLPAQSLDTAAKQTTVNTPELEKQTNRFDDSLFNPIKQETYSEIRSMNHEMSNYGYGNGYDSNGQVSCQADSFFADRNYIKAYEYTVLFIAEGQDIVLGNAQKTTRNDTTEKGLEEYHRQVIIDLLEKANTDEGIAFDSLPMAWRDEMQISLLWTGAGCFGRM